MLSGDQDDNSSLFVDILLLLATELYLMMFLDTESSKVRKRNIRQAVTSLEGSLAVKIVIRSETILEYNPREYRYHQ